MERDFGKGSKLEVKSFQPRNLNAREAPPDYREVKAQFGSLAVTDKDSNSHFKLNSTSKQLLGVEAEELSHIEDRVKTEVEARFEALKSQAYEEGFKKGEQDGAEKAQQEMRAQFEPVLQQVNALLSSFDQAREEIYNANERVMIQLVYDVAKEVLLRELKTDQDYVKRLSAAVIEKIGAKDSIRIRVNRQDYANLEQIRDFLKTQFADLKNIQIDPADDLELGGCKVETDLSQINAAVENQLHAIEASLSGTPAGGEK